MKVLHFQRETLTKHYNRAEDSGLNRSPILQCSIIPIAIAAIIATFAAIQEGYYIGTRREII